MLENQGELAAFVERLIDERTQAAIVSLQGGTAALQAQALSAFLKLAVAADRKVAFGTASVTWPGANQVSNTIAVAHGLGATPIVVLATLTSATGGFAVPATFTYTPTQFSVRLQTVDAFTPAATDTYGIAWLAIG